jgi:hypothetical protein
VRKKRKSEKGILQPVRNRRFPGGTGHRVVTVVAIPNPDGVFPEKPYA